MIQYGIIGMSEGNAHPYSWSSIINGEFDAEEITKVGYPAVAAYLNANRDTVGIPGARVTHVWTQDKSISASIAKSSGIDHITDSLEQMASEVDAVLLTRDDPENHVMMAKPFIEAGLPVFIDKPLAATFEDLDYFSRQVAAGKFIMSCSSQRYANEIRIVKQDLASLGEIQLVTAVGKKDWIKYGVHLMEGIFSLLNDPAITAVEHNGENGKDIVHFETAAGIHINLHLFMDIVGTFQISVFGKNGWRIIDIKNSYSMFRDNIIEFTRSVQEGRPRLDFSKTENIIRGLITATESLKQGGQKIFIK